MIYGGDRSVAGRSNSYQLPIVVMNKVPDRPDARCHYCIVSQLVITSNTKNSTPGLVQDVGSSYSAGKRRRI